MNEASIGLVGTVVGDIKTRETPWKQPEVRFRMVHNARRYDQKSDTWVSRDPLFVTVKCIGRIAERAAKVVGKGRPMIVTGTLSTDEYTASDGQRRSDLVLRAESIGINAVWAETMYGGRAADLPEPAHADPASEPNPPTDVDPVDHRDPVDDADLDDEDGADDDDEVADASQFAGSLSA